MGVAVALLIEHVIWMFLKLQLWIVNGECKWHPSLSCFLGRNHPANRQLDNCFCCTIFMESSFILRHSPWWLHVKCWGFSKHMLFQSFKFVVLEVFTSFSIGTWWQNAWNTWTRVRKGLDHVVAEKQRDGFKMQRRYTVNNFDQRSPRKSLKTA